jgi:hypothetical protein
MMNTRVAEDSRDMEEALLSAVRASDMPLLSSLVGQVGEADFVDIMVVMREAARLGNLGMVRLLHQELVADYGPPLYPGVIVADRMYCIMLEARRNSQEAVASYCSEHAGCARC